MPNIGSQISPLPPYRDWTEETWQWLSEQLEIIRHEMDNRKQLVYADGSDSVNTINTAETLKSFTFPEGVADIAAGQQDIEIVASGTFAATANTHRVGVFLNTSVVVDTGDINDNTIVSWLLRCSVILFNGGIKLLGQFTLSNGTGMLSTNDLAVNINTTNLLIEIVSTSALGEVNCDYFKVTYNRMELQK